MRKSEVKKVADNELIVELAEIYSMLLLNYNDGNREIKQLSKQLEWLTDEMVSRGLITEMQQYHLLHD